MDVKQAVSRAKEYVADLFSEEKPANIGLEEVVFEEAQGEWLITIGFTRPWEKKNRNRLGGLLEEPQRTYKVVSISDATGAVRSVKNYETRH